jgi:hypothetical protein
MRFDEVIDCLYELSTLDAEDRAIVADMIARPEECGEIGGALIGHKWTRMNTNITCVICVHSCPFVAE